MTNPNNQSYPRGSHGQNHNTKDNERNTAGFSFQNSVCSRKKDSSKIKVLILQPNEKMQTQIINKRNEWEAISIGLMEVKRIRKYHDQ